MNDRDYKKYFEILLEASKLINASMNLNDALVDIINAVTQSLNAEAASLLFVNQRSKTLSFKAASGNVSDALKDLSLPFGKGIAGWVAQERKSIIVNDVKSDARHTSRIDNATGFYTRSIIASPVEYQGEVLATLEVLNPLDKEKFDENDLFLLEALASQVAIVIRHCESYSKLNQENLELKRVIHLEHKIVGHSPEITDILQRIAKIAPFDVTVLITGESGTGKELVARAIHDNSPRAKKPFVAVNCTALPENLIESELFGHEKGAFTGAIASRKGKFEMASGGTLFLDEIGDMGFSMQAKILRVLETSIYERVGSDQPIKANVRILAATNKNLKQDSEESKFREDLYYRLNEIQIELPSLKERKNDILLLVNHFINIFASSFNKHVAGISNDVKRLLLNYEWPGNIRELKNVIKAAVVLCETDIITIEDLPDEISSSKSETLALDSQTGSLEEIEKNYILKTLKENNFKKSTTARILNISRPTLDAKIKSYGIEIRK